MHINMSKFRIYDTINKTYIDTNDYDKWCIDCEGHLLQFVYNDNRGLFDIKMREDCVVEWNSGYIDHRGHQIYEGDVFIDENNYVMLVLWYENMWTLHIYGWTENDVWENIDILPMDDFEFDDLIIKGDYHTLGDTVYKGKDLDI